MKNIALIGHSHAVSVLDGISDWRQQARLAGKPQDGRYTPAFQGWFSVDTGGELFSVKTFPKFKALSGMRVCLITDVTHTGELAVRTRLEAGAMRYGASPFLAAFLEEVADCETIVSVLYGSEHALLGHINNLPAYDFAPYTEATQAQPINRRHIDAILDEMTLRVVAPLACIRHAAPAARIVHVPPPPPLRDPAKASVLEAIKDLVLQHGFVPPALTRKWHASYLDALRTELLPLKIEFLDTRREPVCEEGFLKPEYAEGLTHGNSRYGRLLGMRLMEMLGL